jgi:hypothetical protein
MGVRCFQMIPSKKEITQAVLNEIPESQKQVFGIDVDALVFRWWGSGRSGDSLRLTSEGFAAFSAANIKYYEFDLIDDTKDLKSVDGILKKASKRLKCPYYVGIDMNRKDKKTYIRIYDHKIAMMLTLYGSLKEYLESRGYN